MPYTYLVITEVPEPAKGEIGNLAAAFNICEEDGTPHPEWLFSLRVPVFAVGEVLITADGERECVGAGRKPSKWDVVYDEYANLDEAVARAREVQEQ